MSMRIKSMFTIITTGGLQTFSFQLLDQLFILSLMELPWESQPSVIFLILIVLVSDRSEEAEGLGFLIFLAIFMHKAPAAIGFGTFLLHEGLRDWSIAKHLLVLYQFKLQAFTLSCPIFAILTYATLSEFLSSMDATSLMFWSGILLLVSAGSFIYVATIHILPEVFCNTDIHRPHTHKHMPEDHMHD